MKMREIKFRGKCLDNGEWVYGFYRQYPIYKSCGTCIDHLNHFIDTDGRSEFIDPATVGQYTGLKDKNGKEIYEGDSVNVWFGSDSVTMQVIFEIGGWKIKEAFDETLHDLSYYVECDDVEIIGNIHDNPELLKLNEE